MIKEFVQMSEDEEKALAEYTLSKVMLSLYNLTSHACMLSVTEKKGEIARIINDDYVRAVYDKALYIDPRYDWIREYMEFTDVEGIYKHLFSVKIQKPKVLKQKLIQMCDAILRIHYIRFVEMIRDSLKIRSIKKTIIKCFLKLMGKSKGYDEVRVL